MTSTEHHMDRMDKQPVPRFEIVHKPLRDSGIDPRVFGAERTQENPQPWSARFIGANGEQVWRTSESYVDRRDAVRAIRLVLEALLPVEDVRVDEVTGTFASPVPAVDVEVRPGAWS